MVKLPKQLNRTTKDKVNELLNDNKRLIEYALVSVIETLQNDPDRYLLIDKIPTTYNSIGSTQSIWYEGDYQFVKEKVMEIADNLFGKLQKGLVNSALSSLLTMDWKREIYPIKIIESEIGDIAP